MNDIAAATVGPLGVKATFSTGNVKGHEAAPHYSCIGASKAGDLPSVVSRRTGWCRVPADDRAGNGGAALGASDLGRWFLATRRG